MAQPTRNAPTQPPPGPAPLVFRSGAVARLARMPVSTLRIWEQRYQAVDPSTAPSGHRLYSAADVERVVVLRQLTQHGHAIGSLAGLTFGQLRDLAQTHPPTPIPPINEAETETETEASDQPPSASAVPLRLVVVGQALAQRLRRPAVLSRWAKPVQIVAVCDSLAEAVQAAQVAQAAQGRQTAAAPVDLLLWQVSSLQDGAGAEVAAARHAWRARQVAVAYRFAVPAARDALVSASVAVVREPADDGALVAWLSSFEPAPAPGVAVGHTDTVPHLLDLLTPSPGARPLPAPRFDDAALTEFAGLPSSVACECPSHVAELLLQITAFERYSASCANRHLADAELHAHLQRVAGTARLLFEAALARVALADGLALP